MLKLRNKLKYSSISSISSSFLRYKKQFSSVIIQEKNFSSSSSLPLSSSSSSSSSFTLPYIYEIEEENLFYEDLNNSSSSPSSSLSSLSSSSSSSYFSEATSIEKNNKNNKKIEEQEEDIIDILSGRSSSSPSSSLSSSSSFSSSSFSPSLLLNTSLEERQYQIEKRQIAFSEIESVEMTKKLISMGKSGSIKSLQKIFLNWYDPLYNELCLEQELFKQGKSQSADINVYGPILVQLPIEKITVTLLSTSLNILLQNFNLGKPLSQFAIEISNILQIEKDFLLAHSSSRIRKQWINEISDDVQGNRRKIPLVSKKLRKYLDSKEWTRDMKLKVGASLLSIMIKTCRDENGDPIFVHEVEKNTNTKLIGLVRLSQNAYDLIMSDVEFGKGSPRYLPMIIPPMPWTESQCGGYLTHQTQLLRFRSKSQLSILRSAELQRVYHSLNYLGSVPWRINKRVLNVIKELYNRGELVGDLPSRIILPQPSKEECYVPKSKLESYKFVTHSPDDPPPKISENGEEYVFDPIEYKYLCKKIHQKNAENHSLRCDLEIKLQIADEFINDIIYFPWNVDFRGRAYPVPPNLNHMGEDKCRGMLYFAHGKPLGKRGYEWLKCHLCNLFGNNKIPFHERVQWTDNHIDDIIDSAENPIEGKRWWTTAEDPYQALAACFEISEAIKTGNPETYVCHLPIHQDGSCNGLQHYAALGRDKPGGSAVNLTPADRPQDVYTEVLKKVLLRIDQDANSEFNEANIQELSSPESQALLKQMQEKSKKYAQMIQGKVDRKVIKQTVMTSVYGVTTIGARDQVHSKLQEKLFPQGANSKEEEDEAFKAASYLARLTLLSLGDLFTSADEIMQWLGDVAASVGSQGHVMSWITPLGLPVMQPYRKHVTHTVRTILQNITLSLEDEALPVSKQKQRTAFPPNYVHSLDSTHMMMTSLKMRDRNLQFTAVHDSYWTHACDVDIMNEELRNCFVELYQLPLLENLKESIELRYPSITLPPVPNRGQLDIENVKGSPYFFH